MSNYKMQEFCLCMCVCERVSICCTIISRTGVLTFSPSLQIVLSGISLHEHTKVKDHVLEQLQGALPVRRGQHGDPGVVAVQAHGRLRPLPADLVAALDRQAEVGEERDGGLEVLDRDPDVLESDAHALTVGQDRPVDRPSSPKG